MIPASLRRQDLYDAPMSDPSQPTRTNLGGGPGTPGSSFPSIEEGRFPAGTTLASRFRILGLLGKGGMGEVYRALDLTLNQPVALKFISPAHTSEAALARFRNEVRIARQVSHPNVCRVYDIGVIEGLHFLSMEYVDGEDLASLLRRIGRLPSDKALEFTRRICAGLAAAHERGVLHRDLKPANIMIDGRGQVRITDFGLAALAGEVPGGDIRSGTPAYMSPEQKAGKDVTTRSDIYALGLVLHEMFTGARPGQSQATPTTLVKDLDPTIERVILRCLDADPHNRPSSALNVAMALPGGDPIAAALAAGETPSPEMVAASGEKEGLQPRTAIACFVGVALMVVALALLGNKTTLLGRAPLPLPPDAMAEKARVMLKAFGYTVDGTVGGPVDEVYGFVATDDRQSYLRDLRANDFEHRWERLASHRPALIAFWYRQQQSYIQAESFNLLGPGKVTWSDPPLIEQGMVSIFLNANGLLEGLAALPPARSQTAAGRDSVGHNTDWSQLLRAAGLDEARFTPSPLDPDAFIPVNNDARMTWRGDYGERRPDKIIVDAAALNGRPVFFRIVGLADKPEITVTPSLTRIGNRVGVFFVVAVLVAAGLVAWRNVRLGRGDTRAAWRIAAVIFAAGMASWALIASHVPTLWEVSLLFMGLSWAGFSAGAVGLLYLAVEPFVRRHWTDALISWMRMVSGRFRDPLVTSHILVGVSAGLAFALFNAVTLWATSNLSDQVFVGAISNVRLLSGVMINTFVFVAFVATGYLLVLVLLRTVVRRTWVADALFVALVSATNWLLNTPSPALIPVWVLYFAVMMWILRRFGLLAIAAMISAKLTTATLPTAVASWYAAYSLTTPLIFAFVAAWSLYVILISRPGTASSSAGESPM